MSERARVLTNLAMALLLTPSLAVGQAPDVPTLEPLPPQSSDLSRNKGVLELFLRDRFRAPTSKRVEVACFEAGWPLRQSLALKEARDTVSRKGDSFFCSERTFDYKRELNLPDPLPNREELDLCKPIAAAFVTHCDGMQDAPVDLVGVLQYFNLELRKLVQPTAPAKEATGAKK